MPSLPTMRPGQHFCFLARAPRLWGWERRVSGTYGYHKCFVCIALSGDNHIWCRMSMSKCRQRRRSSTARLRSWGMTCYRPAWRVRPSTSGARAPSQAGADCCHREHGLLIPYRHLRRSQGQARLHSCQPACHLCRQLGSSRKAPHRGRRCALERPASPSCHCRQMFARIVLRATHRVAGSSGCRRRRVWTEPGGIHSSGLCWRFQVRDDGW